MRRKLHLPVSVVDESYEEQLIQLFGSSYVAYWPMSEPSGTIIEDASGNNHTGVYINTNLVNYLSPSDKPCPQFNGTSSIADVYSSGLAEEFNGQEGSLALWVKSTSQSNWTDASLKTIAIIQADSNNQIIFLKNAANSLRIRYTSGGVISGTQLMSIAPSSWAHIAISWSKINNFVGLYYNGVLQASFTNLGVWTGSLTFARFGSNTIPATFWAGSISNAILLNRPITAQEVAQIAFTAPNQSMPKIVYIGDSITSDDNDSWVDYVQNNYNGGSSAKINHAAGGTNIIAHMDGQATLAVLDRANTVIMALGTNDNNDGDMTLLQAKVEQNIAKVVNTGARVFYMNVLPKWTDNTGSVVIDKSRIRTAIQAGCVAQNVDCWDTFTEPWITPEMTLDGTHLLSSGDQALATRVLARL